MSQSATPVHAVDQDEDVAAAGGLSDRDQRRYGAAKCSMRGYHNRLPKPDSFVLVLTCSNGKVGLVGPLRTEEIARSWHDELWPDDDLPWSVEPMAAPHCLAQCGPWRRDWAARHSRGRRLSRRRMWMGIAGLSLHRAPNGAIIR